MLTLLGQASSSSVVASVGMGHPVTGVLGKGQCAEELILLEN